MKTKKTFRSKCLKILRWLVLTAVLLFGLQISLLAFPQILFSESTHIGVVTVHHDSLSETQAINLATEIDRKLRGSPFYDSTRRDPVFIFRNRKPYQLYLHLIFLKTVPSGFNLPIFGNSYVCEEIVHELGEATGGQPRFSIWDGDLAHIAAHEIGHQYIADRIGVGRWRKLPHWKQEGLPEFIANIGDTRADPSRSLVTRIEVLQDVARWSRTPTGRRSGWDRVHYEAGLLVEFLLEVRGISLEQLISERTTRSDSYSAMISWASTPKSSSKTLGDEK